MAKKKKKAIQYRPPCTQIQEASSTKTNNWAGLGLLTGTIPIDKRNILATHKTKETTLPRAFVRASRGPTTAKHLEPTQQLQAVVAAETTTPLSTSHLDPLGLLQRLGVPEEQVLRAVAHDQTFAVGSDAPPLPRLRPVCQVITRSEGEGGGGKGVSRRMSAMPGVLKTLPSVVSRVKNMVPSFVCLCL